MRRPSLLVLILLAASLFTRLLRADSPLVVLVHGPAESEIVSEAITRIRGEFVADGFDVVVVSAPDGADPRAVLARADRQTRAAATLGLFLQTDANAAELWVIDRLTNKTVVRRIEMPEAPARSAPEVLARRSVELLRASLLEILIDTRDDTVADGGPRAEASRWAAEALERRPSRWGVEAGAQVLTGFGRLGSAVMPVGRVRAVLDERLEARLSLSGFGTRPRVDAAVGTATVSQELGLLELMAEIAPRSLVRPSLSLGAGVYHVAIEGNATSPYASLGGDRFVFAADTGAGFALSLTTSLALSVEGHVTFVTPYPVIRFLEAETAAIDNPFLSATLTLVGRL